MEAGSISTAPWARPLLLRTQPLEALDKLAIGGSSSGRGKRGAKLYSPRSWHPPHRDSRPARGLQGHLEVGDCVGTGLQTFGLDASHETDLRAAPDCGGRCDDGRAHLLKRAIA